MKRFLTLICLSACLWLTGCSSPPSTGEPSTDHPAPESPTPGAIPKGPHGGKLFKEGGFETEVTIYESGVPPEFRLYLYRDGKPLPPVGVEATVELERLGQPKETVHFKPEEDYLRGDLEIVEPHSFDARVLVKEGGHDHVWSYSQREGRVQMSQEAAERAGITIEKARSVEVTGTLELPGTLALNAEATGHVVSPLAGTVTRIYVRQGSLVQEGEPLAEVSSSELTDLWHTLQEAQHELALAQTVLRREQDLTNNLEQVAKRLARGGDFDSIHRDLLKMRVGMEKAELLEAYSAVRNARDTLKRQETLYQSKLVSRKEVEAARYALETARADYTGRFEEALRHRIETLPELERKVDEEQHRADFARRKMDVLGVAGSGADSVVLRSPVAGTVIERDVVQGEFVEASGEPLFQVADLSTIWVSVSIPEKDLAQVRVGQRARVEGAGLASPLQTTLSYIGPLVGAETRSAQGRLLLPNRAGKLRPGQFVRVFLEGNLREELGLAVRPSALQTFRDWDVVFIKSGDEYEVRPVEIGRRSEEWVEITGLWPGATYVTEGSYILKADLEKSGATHDH
ncbi:MAG: hypothetical protein AMXMBFR33_20630 [Candidatus Xenobia bacterium]